MAWASRRPSLARAAFLTTTGGGPPGIDLVDGSVRRDQRLDESPAIAPSALDTPPTGIPQHVQPVCERFPTGDAIGVAILVVRVVGSRRPVDKEARGGVAIDLPIHRSIDTTFYPVRGEIRS